MAFWDDFLNTASAVESEQPPDTIEKGRYPMRSINAQLIPREGTSRAGEPYAFGELRIQWQVTEGPAKGQTTWMRHTVSLPDKGLDEAARKRATYFTQHFLDASGAARKLDPNWQREERPHPTKAGKTMTVFRGRLLTRDQLLAVAKNEAAAQAFAKLFVGLTGIVGLSESEFTRADGGTGLENRMSNIEPLTDAALSRWRSDTRSDTGSGAAQPKSVYAQ